MASDPISAAARGEFLKSSPPRVVSQEIYQKIAPWRDAMVPLLIGALFLLLGLVLSWAFVPRHGLQQWRLGRGGAEQLLGKILTLEQTHSTENGARVWKYQFEFRPPGNAERKGEAYTTGQPWKEGQSVQIRYLPADPEIAVPVGARLDEFSWGGSFVVIFPLAGLLIIIGPFFSRLAKQKLLREGVIGHAVVNAIEKSNFQTKGGQTFYKLRMTLRPDGVQIQKNSSDSAEITVAEEKLKSGEPLTLVYDRNKPKRFLIIESWAPNAAGTEAERYLRENPVSATAPVTRPQITRATDEFLRMTTPRRIPREIMKKAVPGSGMLPLQIFGAVFLALGLSFSWISLPFYLPKQWLLDVAPSRTVLGKIVSVEDGRMEIDHAKVMKHRFRYQPGGIGEKEGVAYRSASEWVVGTPVTVRYLTSIPAVAVPEGARMGAGTLGMSMILIFPLIGAGALFGPMAFRFKKLQILRNGRVSTATIISVDKTSVLINDEPQYVIHLTRAGDGVKMDRRTHFKDEVAFAMRKWQDGEPVKILYLPDKPKRFLLPESWNE